MDHIQIQMNKNSVKLSIEQLLEQFLKKINEQTKLINILRDSKNDMKAFRKKMIEYKKVILKSLGLLIE